MRDLLRRFRRRRKVQVDEGEFRRLLGLRPTDPIPASPGAAVRAVLAAYQIVEAESDRFHALDLPGD